MSWEMLTWLPSMIADKGIFSTLHFEVGGRDMIFITGDIHGGIDIAKLNSDNFPDGKSLTKSDFVIIAGDFGLVWDGSNEEKYWLNWLRQKNFTTLFVDGNHENFYRLKTFPIQKWNGGNIHIINDSVYHLMRGQVFVLEGMKFFTFGGASSHDRENRTENISWWPEEMPLPEEFTAGLNNLNNHDWKIDFIVTHACSGQTFHSSALPSFVRYDYPESDLTRYFDMLEAKVQFNHWFFGHFHQDLRISSHHTALFQDVVNISHLTTNAAES